MAKRNIFWLIRRTPMPQATRLRLQRYFMDRASARLHPDDDSWEMDYHFLEEDERAFYSR